jgi:hypothetical protein
MTTRTSTRARWTPSPQLVAAPAKGGSARAENLTTEERRQIARKAAAARWRKGYSHGKPQTIYRLTEKGREVFRPETEAARIANDSGR